MCESCQNIATYNVKVKNSYDPTRTTTLRNLMVRESNRRFRIVENAVYTSVYTNNVFGIGLDPAVFRELPREAYRFMTDDRKLAEFIAWLEQLSQDEIIEIYGIPDGVLTKNWLDKYLRTAYEQGISRARQELRKAGYDVPTITATGGVATIMNIPVHIDALALVYTRTYNDLKGITAQMSQQVGRVLAENFASGANPRVIARRLVATINGKGVGDLGITDTLGRFIPAKRRAEILARTEIIRAHHYANIHEYMSWGVHGVYVEAEISTAGDDRVCAECASLEGQIYSLEEALTLLPRHPQCRCIALPRPKGGFT